MAVVADTVSFDSGTQTLTGQWKITPDGTRYSRGTGGACVVVAAKELLPPGTTEQTCSTDNDCQDDAAAAFGAGSYGYCHPTEKKCWVKPPTDVHNYCNRSGDAAAAQTPTRWDFGQHITNTAAISLDNDPVPGRTWPKVTRWRTIACLNDYDSDAKDFRACQDPNPNPHRQVSWGKQVTINRK